MLDEQECFWLAKPFDEIRVFSNATIVYIMISLYDFGSFGSSMRTLIPQKNGVPVREIKE
jgi:hypothetical protein